MPVKDFISRQADRIISDNSPTTLMGLRSLVRFNSVPTWLVYLTIIAIVGSWMPLAAAVRTRFVRNEKPRIHIFQDMDNQPRYGAQAANPVFANNMSMRPLIPGTVARGHLEESDFLNRGFRVVGAGAGEGAYEVEFFDGFPPEVKVTPELLAKGKELWAQYCYLCHGYDGYGNGPVHVRALQRVGDNPNWIQPSSMHDDVLRGRPAGHLYNTVNNGIRSMQGYGAQIQAAEDRWAVVAYVRALQLSQHAPPEAIPESLRGTVAVRPSAMNGKPMVVGAPADEQPGATQPATQPSTRPIPAGDPRAAPGQGD